MQQENVRLQQLLLQQDQQHQRDLNHENMLLRKQLLQQQQYIHNHLLRSEPAEPSKMANTTAAAAAPLIEVVGGPVTKKQRRVDRSPLDGTIDATSVRTTALSVSNLGTVEPTAMTSTSCSVANTTNSTFLLKKYTPASRNSPYVPPLDRIRPETTSSSNSSMIVNDDNDADDNDDDINDTNYVDDYNRHIAAIADSVMSSPAAKVKVEDDDEDKDEDGTSGNDDDDMHAAITSDVITNLGDDYAFLRQGYIIADDNNHHPDPATNMVEEGNIAGTTNSNIDDIDKNDNGNVDINKIHTIDFLTFDNIFVKSVHEIQNQTDHQKKSILEEIYGKYNHSITDTVHGIPIKKHCTVLVRNTSAYRFFTNVCCFLSFVSTQTLDENSLSTTRY